MHERLGPRSDGLVDSASGNKRRIPVFTLYGEGYAWRTPDLLHCETIPARSRLHDWRIQRHRHADLTQVLCLQQGRADVFIEDEHRTVQHPSIHVIPAACVHGFDFSQDVDGYILTIAAPLLQRLKQLSPGAHRVLQTPAGYPLGSHQGEANTIWAVLQREYAQVTPGREAMLEAILTLIVTWLSRQVTGEGNGARLQERSERHFALFSQLVEQHFREQLTLAAYSARVGITAAYLNDICHKAAGRTALAVVHDRVLLEAKRNLLFTTLDVNQISDFLGFSEPAYFSRFFRRMTGVAPKQFRKQGLSNLKVDRDRAHAGTTAENGLQL